MNEHIRQQLGIINQQIKELTGVYHSAASRSGISDNEFWVWYALVILGGEYSQQDICDTWSLPKQTVNSVVSNLSKKGYVYLQAVPDRNRKMIRLTDEGKKYGENIVTQVYQAELSALEKISEEARKTFIGVLSKYITCLKEETTGNEDKI